MTDELPPTPLDSVYINYCDICQEINELYKQLRNELSNHGITFTEPVSFADLIHSIDNIQTFEKYYDNNIEPIQPAFIEDKEKIKNMSYNDFNIALAKQLNYYMKLLGYYLKLKGINKETVNHAKTLSKRIALIKFIDIYSGSFLIIKTNSLFRCNTTSALKYLLIDINGNKIKYGTVTLKKNGQIVKEVDAGETIFFTPDEEGEQEYTLEYNGEDSQYLSQSKNFTIKVLKEIKTSGGNEDE